MDDELSTRLSIWVAPKPRIGLAEQIVANAVARPSLTVTVRQEIRLFFSDWRYGLIYKAAALAACAVIGLAVSLTVNSMSVREANLDEAAFMLGVS